MPASSGPTLFGRPAWQVVGAVAVLALIGWYLWKKYQASQTSSTTDTTATDTGTTTDTTSADELGQIEAQLAELEGQVGGSGGGTPSESGYTPPPSGYGNPGGPEALAPSSTTKGNTQPATTTGEQSSAANKTYLDVDIAKAREEQLAAAKARAAGDTAEAAALNKQATQRKRAEKGAKTAAKPKPKAKQKAG